ncbi:MAG: nucleotidyltransferase domain-containing protein [Hyphomicrobiaceae bacterium]|nr:nucleotidyltransferase domain-containing protein [Hyphomicrobiaceae bacterium]
MSINKENKRKRDGVYYTPEWVVERIVYETLNPRLDEIKLDCGWPEKGLPNKDAIDAYLEKLKSFKVVDPACGSGAFLITVLRYLMEEWHVMLALRKDVTGKYTKLDEALRSEIDLLISSKADSVEADTMTRNDVLDNFTDHAINEERERPSKDEQEKQNVDKANALFKKMVTVE